MPIPFTQYHLPNGWREIVIFDPDDEETHKKAKRLIEVGLRFDIEMLSNGIISMSCEDNDEKVWAIELSENGPGIEIKVKELVDKAYKRKFPEENSI